MVAALQISIRAGFSAGISLVLAQMLGMPHPIYAMIAAVIVTDLSPVKTRMQGVPRLGGTLVGATIGAAACTWLPQATWSIALAIGISMFACHALGAKDAAKLAGYVSGIVLLQQGVGEPWLYAVERLAETALGIGVAIVASMVPKLLRGSAPQAPAP